MKKTSFLIICFCALLYMGVYGLIADSNDRVTSSEQNIDTIRSLFISFSTNRQEFVKLLDKMFTSRDTYYCPITYFWLFCNEKIKDGEQETTIANYVAKNIALHYFKKEELDDFLRPFTEAFYTDDNAKKNAIETTLCNLCKSVYSGHIQFTTGAINSKQITNGIIIIPAIELNLEDIRNNPIFLIFTNKSPKTLEEITLKKQLPQYVYVYLSYFLYDKRLASDKRELRYWVAQKIALMLGKNKLTDVDALQVALRWREYTLNKFAPFDKKKILYAIADLDGKTTYSYSPPEYSDEQKKIMEKYSYRCFIGETCNSLEEAKRIRPEEVKVLILKEPFNKFPEQIFNYINLERLTFVNSKFKSLPERIKVLERLRYLEIINGELHTIPESLKEIKTLQVISFRNNKISALPDFIFAFPDLRDLDISGNNLTNIPQVSNPEYLKKINSIFVLEGNNIPNKQIELLKKFLPDGAVLK